MPQDESDPQGVLRTIRENLVPLLIKRIQDHERNTESLVVLNSLSEFACELGIFTVISGYANNLLSNDDSSYSQQLHELFQMLNGLIDEQILCLPQDSLSQEDPLSNSKYRKINAFLKRVKVVPNSSSLPKLLHLPETFDELKEADQTLTNFNEKSGTRLKDAVYPGVTVREEPESKSTLELERVKQSHESLASLWVTLEENISASECKSTHVAKLQIRSPAYGSQPSARTEHKIFVSSCPSDDQSPEVKWQETTCHIFSELEPSSHRRIRKVCKAIRSSIVEYQNLELVVHAQLIYRSLNTPIRIKSPFRWPTKSLREILSNEDFRFTIGEKIRLGLNLSQALLQIYNSGMRSKDWTAENIFFLFSSQDNSLYEVSNPYFARALRQIQTSDAIEDGRASKFWVLVALAQMLLEIALGRTLGPFEDPLDIGLLEFIDQEDIAHQLKDNMVEEYLKAACCCLEANKEKIDFDCSDDENEEGISEVPNEESQCRAVLITAINHLKAAHKGFGHSEELNKPRRINSSQTTQSQSSSLSTPPNYTSTAQLSHSINSQDILNGATPNQLFDVRKIRIDAGDERLQWAEDYFTQADRFYGKFVVDHLSERKIRIAILDTGIDLSNNCFRGITLDRKKKDTPFKEMKSFVGSPNEYLDTCGHGTDVAHLVLKVSPDADLYIAKISNGHVQKGAAIKWAQELNADIINMSFAFSSNQPGIKRAIEDAEHGGVIFFAAASNNGGNTGRMFPARMDKVICLHASDGNGNKSGMDPSPKRYSENFSTLGMAISSVWSDEPYLNGTSFSAPIAAATAANVLLFVEHATKKGWLTVDQHKEAFSRTGMKSILIKMSEERDGYQFVTPWRKMWHETSTEEEVALKIREALRDC